MVFIVRDQDALSRLDTARKLIKARDFWVFKDAQGALAEALREKSRILQAAQEAYRRESERGYAEGKESALLKQSGSMIELVTQTVDYFGKVEAEMVDLVIDAVRKVVSDFDDRQRLTTVVKSCLDLVRSQKQLSLSVHPSQVAFLRGQVDVLRENYPSLAQIDVHPDARLALDACVVESDIGVVEASLSGQVEVLRETLGAVLAPAVAQAEAGETSPAPVAPDDDTTPPPDLSAPRDDRDDGAGDDRDARE